MKNRSLLFLLIAAWSAGAQTVTTVAGGNGPGSNANQLYYPYGLWLDAGGNIYVSDQYNNRIQKFPAGSTSSTDGVTVAGGNGQGNDSNQLTTPYGLFLDGSGNIYVADWGNGRIQAFPAGSTSATDGVTVAGGNGPSNLPDQLNDPLGVFVDTAGNLYVADADNDRIQEFPPGSSGATNGVTVAGGRGLGDNAWQLSYPSSVFLDDSGHIYVADYLNNRIQRFTPPDTNGVTVAGGNGMGSNANQFNSPTGVFVDHSGNIYVADFYNDRIQKFPPGSDSTTNGITVAGGNGEGGNDNQLNNPSSVYVDSSGNIYIADYLNNRIQMWNPNANGINDIHAGQGSISLYPSPNNGSFILQTSSLAGSDYIISDIVGRIVAQGDIEAGKQSIMLKDISSGTYLLEVNGSGQKAVKFVVEN